MRPLQVIAYKPIYFRITGSIEASLMLSQAEYYTNKGGGNDAFSKTSNEWEKETGLTYWKQKSARNILRQFSFWEEFEAGIPSRLYYRVDIGELKKYINSIESDEKQEITEYYQDHEEYLDDFEDTYYTESCEEIDTCIEDYSQTSMKESNDTVRVNSSYKCDEISNTIIYIESIKNNTNINTTEKKFFGESTENVSTKLRKDSVSMKKSNTDKATLISEYENKLLNNDLMEKFNGLHDWYSEIIKSQRKFIVKSLSARLAQGKINPEDLEGNLQNSKTISDLLLAFKSDKYSNTEILKDLVYIYTDGLVSSWSRESKAIKTLLESVEDGIISMSEIDDCLIWIKNTANYSMSLTSVIPSMQYFRKYRIPILGHNSRYMCTYSFNKKPATAQVSNQKNITAGTEDLDGFFSNQRLRK